MDAKPPIGNTPKDCPMVHTENYEGRERRSFHIDRTVNLGHILTTITMIASLLVVLSKFDTRLTLVESHIDYQRVTNERHEQTDRAIQAELKQSFDRLELKLDKVLMMANRTGSHP